MKDTSPIKFELFEFPTDGGTRWHQAVPPLQADVCWSTKGEVYEARISEFNVLVWARDRDKLVEEVRYGFAFLWENYARGDQSQMTLDAISLGDRLRARLVPIMSPRTVDDYIRLGRAWCDKIGKTPTVDPRDGQVRWVWSEADEAAENDEDEYHWIKRHVLSIGDSACSAADVSPDRAYELVGRYLEDVLEFADSLKEIVR